MVVVYPVPQAVEDHFPGDGMVAVDRVAAAGVVAIVLAAVLQHVIDAVLQALEAQGRAVLVALGGVIENHVQDHLDVRRVEGPHHLLELADLGPRLRAHRVPAVRSEEANRVVAPVIGPRRAVAETIEDGELVDRHQLDRRNAQRLQVRDLLDYALVGSRVLDVARGRLRKTADVGLVDDRFGQVAAEVAVALPIEFVVDHHALGRANNAPLGGQEITRQRLAIRVDQSRLRVEAIPSRRLVRAIGLKMIELSRAGSRNEYAPYVPPTVQVGIILDKVRRLGVVNVLVEQNSHGRRATAENDELNPSIVSNRTIGERMRELERRLPLRHDWRLMGKTGKKPDIGIIARTGNKRHLFSPLARQG